MPTPDDEQFLDALFGQAVDALARGEHLDLAAALQGREALRQRAEALVLLARDVTPGTPPPPTKGAPVVPGFTLLEEIGRGGCGIVYRARQESLGRDIALKVLAPALAASTRARHRFAVEARALARLRHRHVVTVHEVLVGEAVCAYAMDWIDGPTLAQAIERGDPRLVPTTIARLFADLAHALVAVHAAGLVHRDIKPGNVLLRSDGSPVLTDFSLVHDAAHSLHTETGHFLGTAAYAAPEQLRGEHDRVGPAADVYSLGVTLYVALTGQTPFGATSISETLRRIEGGRSVPVARANPRVGRDLATIVGKAMEPDPRRRYASAAAFADDLERLLDNRPILARPLGPMRRMARWTARNPWLAAAMASLVLGSASTTWFAVVASANADRALGHQQTAERRADENADLARQKAQLASEEAAARADAERHAAAERTRAEELELVLGFQTAQWSQLDLPAMGRLLASTLTGRAPKAEREALAGTLGQVNLVDVVIEVLHDELLGRAVQTAEEHFTTRPAVQARLLLDLGTTLSELHQLARAAPPLQKARQLLGDLYGPGDLRTLRADHHLATLLLRQGRLAEAEARLRGVLEAAPTDAAGERLAASVRATLATALLEAGKFTAVEELMGKALSELRTAEPATRRLTITAASAWFSALAHQGRHEEAERICREVLAVAEAFLEPDDDLRIVARSNLGGILLLQRRLAEAEPLLAEDLARRRAKHGSDHRLTLNALEQYGMLLKTAGRLDEAEPLLLEALAGNRRLRGNDHPNTLSSIGQLGQLQVRRRNWVAAEGHLREAFVGLRAHPDHQYLLVLGEEFATVLTRLRRLGEAVGVHRELLALHVRRYGEQDERTSDARAKLASALFDHGAYDEAQALQREVVAQRRAGPSKPESMIAALRALARTHLRRNEHDDADSLLREALAMATAELPADHRERMRVIALAGDLAFARNDFRQAEQAHRDALAIAERTLGPDSVDTLSLQGNIAQSLRRIDRVDEAEALLRAVYAAHRRLSGESDTKTTTAAATLAVMLMEAAKGALGTGVSTDQRRKAEARLLEAHGLFLAVRGPGHARTRECTQALVDFYTAWHAAEPDPELAAKRTAWSEALQGTGKVPGDGR